jgi:hypothetical protein
MVDTGVSPASFVVIETARATYLPPHCHDSVVEAPAPRSTRLIAPSGRVYLVYALVSSCASNAYHCVLRRGFQS